MRDPQIYTREDRYMEYVSDNMPDMSEVNAAALALLRAMVKLEQSRLVRSVDPIKGVADCLAEFIVESLNFNEDDDYELCIRTEMTVEVEDAAKGWVSAISRERDHEKMAIDIASMAKSILMGGRA